MAESYDIPVVFCTFNRIEPVKIVFEKIKILQPQKIYLVSDGPRDSKIGEYQLVSEVRDYLDSSIDWECDVQKIYADNNLGCARRISSALDIVFSKEEYAVILEDDCLPADSFFDFISTILKRYKNSSQIYSVCGSTEIEYVPEGDIDYYYTKVFQCCGWGTWKRVWKKFDINMSNFNIEKNNVIFKRTLFNVNAYWNNMAQFDALYRTENKFSWAYIFYYYSILNDGYHILPKTNLIDNVGFSDDSTHTSTKPKYYVTEIKELDLPIRIREDIVWEREYDRLYYKLTQKNGWIVKLKQILGLDINKSIFRK